jgi:hypothetical protein
MVFSDISVVACGTPSSTVELFRYCIQSFRTSSPRVHFKIHPTTQTTTENFQNHKLIENRRIEKIKSSWDCCFVSDVPLTKPISYFELKVHALGHDGIYIGVTDDTDQRMTGPIDKKRTCAYYNYSDGNYNSNPVVISTGTANLFSLEDIIGVVVDKIADRIEFYINGKYFTQGVRKVSDFKQLYAFIAVFYSNQAIETCEKYALSELNRPI